MPSYKKVAEPLLFETNCSFQICWSRDLKNTLCDLSCIISFWAYQMIIYSTPWHKWVSCPEFGIKQVIAFFSYHCYETPLFTPCLIKSFNQNQSENFLRTLALALKNKTIHFLSQILHSKMLKIQMPFTHLQSTWPPYSHSFLSWITGKKASSSSCDGMILINVVYRKSAQDN